MKLLHTGDWQLGRAFTTVEGKAERLRQVRLETVSNIMALARQERVDAILAAGDLLEDNRVQFKFVEEMARRLQDSPVPVYLLPGNHNPLTHDSPYLLHRARFGAPVVVLTTAEPMAIGPAMLYPCPAQARTSKDDPTEWIPPRRPEDGLRIGLAHGPQQGTPDPAGYPIRKDAAERSGLDYLALGHWHGTKEITPRTWYCGTPEATSFAENGGNVLLVELDRPGDAPRVQVRAVETYHWLEEERSIHSSEDVDQLRHLLEARADSVHTLLRLRLQGAVAQTDLLALEALQTQFEARYFHLRIENRVAIRSADAPVFRHPLLRAMAQQLTAAMANPDTAGAARRALSMLVGMVAESRTHWGSDAP